MKKRDVNFELDLMPVISVLAVCIGFLLLTAVWINVGTMDISQAIGEPQAEQEEENKASLWLQLKASGEVQVSFRDLSDIPDDFKNIVLSGKDRRVDQEAVRNLAQGINERELKIETALILPVAETPYDDLILMMDSLRRHDLKNIGITPL